jgi:hypothetical protein
LNQKSEVQKFFGFFSFRHDAGIFRPNKVSRRNFDGMKTPNPSCFGVWGGIGRKAEVQNPNGVSAKCAIETAQSTAKLAANGQRPMPHAALLRPVAKPRCQ